MKYLHKKVVTKNIKRNGGQGQGKLKHSYRTLNFTKFQKLAVILPIHTIGDTRICNNYGGISLLTPV